MITTSPYWKEYVNYSSVFHIKATLTGGSTLNLTDGDFMINSVQFTDSMSGMSEIELGAVVTNTFSATLNNNTGKFDDWDWDRITVWYGIVKPDESEEWIQRGVYNIDLPESIGDTVQIDGWDDMDLMNKEFTTFLQSVTFPTSLQLFMIDMCAYCNVDFGNTDFNFTMASFPTYEKPATCRDALSWICEVNGGYARINPNTGYLDLKQWETAGWEETLANFDGGTENPWSNNTTATTLYDPSAVSSGWTTGTSIVQPPQPGGVHSDYMAITVGDTYRISPARTTDNGYIYFFDHQKNYLGKQALSDSPFKATANGYMMFNTYPTYQNDFTVYKMVVYDGGTIDPWVSVGGTIDGGDMFDGSVYTVDRIKRMTIMAQDAEVTGIRMWAYNPSDPSDHDNFEEMGTYDYMLPIIDNPFCTYVNVGGSYEIPWLQTVWDVMDGFKVRPFELSMFGDPSIEAGDTIILFDARKSKYYVSMISNMTFSLNGGMTLSFEALTPKELANEMESYL